MTQLALELWLVRIAALAGTLLFVKYRAVYIRYWTGVYARQEASAFGRWWVQHRARFYGQRDARGLARCEWVAMLIGFSLITVVVWSTALFPQSP